MSYQSQPLGTIISSVLNYDQLCRAIDENPAIDNLRSTYAPCDGRSIVGSRLESTTQGSIKNTPDLRGKFLRGLNVMYSVGQPLPFDEKKIGDPQPNRVVMDYQGDTLMDHTHNFKYGNPQDNAGGGHERAYVGNDFNRTLKTEGVNEQNSTETRPRNVAVYFYIKIN